MIYSLTCRMLYSQILSNISLPKWKSTIEEKNNVCLPTFCNLSVLLFLGCWCIMIMITMMLVNIENSFFNIRAQLPTFPH